MTANFSGFDLVFEEDEPQNSFSGFDLVFEEDKPQPVPEAKTTATGVVGSAIRGAAGGFAGFAGDVTDLFGRGFNALLNGISGQSVDFDEIKEQGAQQRNQRMGDRDFSAFSTLQDDNAGFMQKMQALQDLQSDDGIAPPPFNLPTTEEVQRDIIDPITGGRLKPTTGAERIAGKAGEFAGAMAFPFGASGQTLAKGATAGALGQTAREAGLGTLGELAGIIGGFKGFDRVSAIGKGTPHFARNMLTAEGRARNLATIIPKGEIKKDVLEAFKAEGIQAPPSAINDGNIVRGVQTVLAESALSGQALDELRKKVTRGFVDSFKKSLSEISEIAPMERVEAGEALKSALVEAEESSASVYRNLYETATSAVPEGAQVIPKKFSVTAKDTLKKMRKSLSPSEDEKKVMSILEGYVKKAFDNKGNLQPIEVEELLATKRSLNDIIPFDVKGGAKKVLNRVRKPLIDELSEYGKQNKKFGRAFQEAERLFGEHADTFRNRNIGKALFEENPEKLLNLGNEVGKLRQVEDALKVLGEEGEKTYAAFRRAKFEDKFRDHIISSKDRSARFAKASTVLGEGRQMELVKELVGEKAFPRIQRLQKIAQGVQEGAEKFMNPSKSGVRMMDATFAGLVLSDFIKFMATGSPSVFLMGVAKASLPRLTANMISNPAFVEELEKLSKAGKGNNPKAYFESLQDLAKIMAPEIEKIASQGEENQ